MWCLRGARLLGALIQAGVARLSSAISKGELSPALKNCDVSRSTCRRDGEVRAWGINDYGQLGNGSTTYETKPCAVVGLEDVHVADVAAGGWHSLAISRQGGA